MAGVQWMIPRCLGEYMSTESILAVVGEVGERLSPCSIAYLWCLYVSSDKSPCSVEACMRHSTAHRFPDSLIPWGAKEAEGAVLFEQNMIPRVSQKDSLFSLGINGKCIHVLSWESKSQCTCLKLINIHLTINLEMLTKRA